MLVVSITPFYMDCGGLLKRFYSPGCGSERTSRDPFAYHQNVNATASSGCEELNERKRKWRRVRARV